MSVLSLAVSCISTSRSKLHNDERDVSWSSTIRRTGWTASAYRKCRQESRSISAGRGKIESIYRPGIVADAAYNCPVKDGQYEDNKQCDKYYECNDGIPVEKLCPDGLVFDPLNRKVNKCDHVFNVDCGDRLELRKIV